MGSHPPTPPTPNQRTDPQCYTTMGEPHAKALAKAEAEGIALPQTVEALRAQASAFLLKAAANSDKDAAAEEPHPFASWFGGGDPADKGPPVPEFYLPSRYLPAFWPLFFLGTVATLHALAVLLQVWLVDARCWVRFRRVGSVHKATHVRVSFCAGLMVVKPHCISAF